MLIDDYIYLAIIAGIQIIGIIAAVVWLYKDNGVVGVIKFIVSALLVSAVLVCLPKLWN